MSLLVYKSVDHGKMWKFGSIFNINIIVITVNDKCCVFCRDVDVTGVTTVNRSVLAVVQNSILLSSNSSFNALDGNPFSVFEPEEEDDNDDVDDDDNVVSVGSDKSADDPDIYGLFTEDHHFTNRYCRI